MNDKKVFILEGNIGSGKSTFLRLAKKYIRKTEIIFEPTDKWQKVGEDGNLLDLFYKDTKRWAYTFQSYAFISRIQTQIEYMVKSQSGIFFMERSVYCDRYCFAKNCFDIGLMSSLEWQIYKEWFSWLVENYMPKPAGFIYLKVSPKICYERLKKRARSEEVDVTLKYLESLHERHDDWLVKQKNIGKDILDIPVLVLNCDNDFEGNLEYQRKHMMKVESFIESLGEQDNISQAQI